MKKSVIIVGGGPAGMAAAVKLYENGVRDILILEREKHLGGILCQCIHDGFGLARFGETLSGPEYSQKFIDRIKELGISYLCDTTVLDITPDKQVYAVSRERGMLHFQAASVVLTMGCRERTRGALSIPGSRPSGIYNAGVAQAYMNLYNMRIGKKAVILGSGDIGLIMARRLMLEGAQVSAVFEIRPYASGLPRNIQQCLRDYGIPLYLSHTVTEIHGKSRLEAVTVSMVDDRMNPIPGTEKVFDCDTLLLAVGLIPENELSLSAGVELDKRTKGAVVDENYQTSVDGIFAAGNVLHVHDLADFVSAEAERLAMAVLEYLKRPERESSCLDIETDGNLAYTVPQKVTGKKDFLLSFRVKEPIADRVIEITQNGRLLAKKKIIRALPAEMLQIPVEAALLRKDGNIRAGISGGC